MLLDAFSHVLQDFTYDDVRNGPSPMAWASLEIINPLADPADPTNWQASSSDGGSPGTDGAVISVPGDYDGNQIGEETTTIHLDGNIWQQCRRRDNGRRHRRQHSRCPPTMVAEVLFGPLELLACRVTRAPSSKFLRRWQS